MSGIQPDNSRRRSTEEQDASAEGTAEVSGVKRKRKNGPFKRSRTGCGTCKKRGKKCDEDWTEEGFCQRCISGQWACTGRSEPMPNRSESYEVALPQHPGSVRAASSSSIPAPPGSTPKREGSNVSAIPTHLARPSNPLSTPAHTFFNPGNHTLHQSTSSSSGNGVLDNSYPFPSPALTVPNIAPTPSSAFPAFPSQGAYDWSANPVFSNPSSLLTTCPDGSLAIDATAFGWNGQLEPSTTDLWDDFDHIFSSAGQESTPAGHMANQSRVLFLNNERPMRQGVSLAEIYARVVESWLVGIPPRVRDFARARIMALNDNKGVMRAVRYAVATAYIFLFACGPQGLGHGTTEPQPKLVELAFKGAGVQQPSSTNASPAEPTPTEGGSENTVKKLRLYVDSVSTPFAADLESSKWTDDAIKELRQVVVTDKKQLSDLLWGVIDLQLVEFIRGGAAPSYNMLALGDRLVQSAMGNLHPALTLGELRTSETFSLRLYALSDISRCIVHRGRRTIFNFWTDPETPDIVAGESNEEFCWSAYLGLPDSVVIILAAVVNLCADMTARSAVSVETEADELERAIRNWQPTQLANVAALDATAVVSRTIAGQLWRLCALILLYQSVHRVGGLHPVLRRARAETLSLLDSIVRLPNGDLWGFIGLPSFLAASLSISETDRQRSMQHMMRPGPEKMWLDNIALIEKVWEEVDQTGRPVDWYDKLQRENMSVAFF